MEIKIQLDPACREPVVLIRTDQVTEEVQRLLRALEEPGGMITGFQDGQAVLLDPGEILHIYTRGKGVCARTGQGEFTLRLRLYEAEEKLKGRNFVRISNSEIVNLKKVRRLDLNLAGTICLRFTDGGSTYVSRRYVGKIKAILGI